MKKGNDCTYPFSVLSSAKRRPAPVVSQAESFDGDFIAAFIASNAGRTEPDTDYLLEEGDDSFANSGLRTPSLIKLAKLATLSKSIFTGELGSLRPSTMRRTDGKPWFALGL